jgi:4-hydroxy-tetrahydrodipicolinate reductase
MINVLINGINGRMGQEVLNAIKHSDNFNVCCGVDKLNDMVDVPVYTDINLIKEKPDIIIDFSIPEATMNVLEYAKLNSIPVVIATTGFSEDQLLKIKDYSNYIPVFRSSNMSYEINIMSDIVAKLAVILRDSDIEIVETHHRNKVDAPSGTALILANSINNARNNELNYQYNRHDVRQKRPDNEIGIHSIRGGTEVGKHSVLFFGENESFEITHTVTSRSIFAKGSLKAAEFLVQKEPGLYSMSDLM